MIEIKPKQVKIVHKPPYLPCVYFQVPLNEAINDFKKLEGKQLDGYVLTLKKPKNKSLTANAYMWQLCGKMAKAIGVTKDDVYKEAVREVGAYIEMVVRSEEADKAAELWETNGIGWFAEPYHKGEGTMVLRFYQGSSVYDGEQMNRLINHVVDEAKHLGIDVISTTEKERLIQLWEQKGT